ncbi:MAG TPA: cytochrome c, partial [Longimicrobiales bacterium]|nr:cytochrome c [Longimicrobiales bacterium]
SAPRPGPPEAALAPATVAAAPEATPPPEGGIYAGAQADRGRSAFREVCAECHYSSEFRDQKFRFKWRRRTVGDLYRDIVRNMPDDAPGSLPDQEYVDIVAYILQLNGFPPGSAELPADEVVLAGYSMTPPAPPPAPTAAW